MSAIMALIMAHLKAGDHIVASNALFGATVQMLSTILPRFGITTTFVPQTDVAAWAAANGRAPGPASDPAGQKFSAGSP